MCRKLFSGIVTLSFIFLFCDSVLAKSAEYEISELKTQIKAMQKQINQMQKNIQILEVSQNKNQELQELTQEGLSKVGSLLNIFEGVNVGAGVTFVLQATDHANNNNADKEDVADASYSVDLQFEREFADYAKGFIHLEAGGGAGVEDELKVFSNVNRDADNDENVRLTEVWYEYYLDKLPATLTVGKIDATCFIDTNEYANDECAQFLGRIFRNSPTIEFADNAAGLRLGLEPIDSLDAELVLMDGDSDWEDAFDNIFFSGQLNFKPKLLGRPGNYRILGWINDNDHTKWSDSSQTKENACGVGISFDQRFSDNIGAFVRYGWQDPQQRLNGLDDDFSLEHAWSTGLQLSGNLWNRGDDILAFAVGQAIPSQNYKDANTLNAKNEGHFETYYNYKVNDYLALTPDLQVIWNPYGDDATVGDDTIVVGGLRGQVDF